MASKKVVMGAGDRVGLRVRDGERVAHRMLGWLGAAFLLVGLVDLALLWYPLDFGNAAWEFATLGRTLDSVPMAGLGLGLVTFAVLKSSGRRGRTVRVLGAVFLITAVVFVLMGALLATAVPEVVRQTGPESMLGLNRAVVRHAAEAVCYTAVFGWVGFRIWRSVERDQ